MKKALIILLCALAVFAIVSCKEEPKKPVVKVKTYDVTFDSQGGSEVAKATVEQGALLARPEKPTLETKAFAGWYTEAGCENRYDFSTPVTADATLYARWIDDYEGIVSMIGSKGVNEGVYKYDKFRIQFGDGTAQVFAPGDVLVVVYRSSRPTEKYSIRGSKKWLYEQPGSNGDLPEGFLSEADEDGWITLTFTFGTKQYDGTTDYPYAAEKVYYDFIGTFIKDDILEIKSATKNGTPIAFTVKHDYVYPTETTVKASESPWTGDTTYVVQFLDPLKLDSDSQPTGTATAVIPGQPVAAPEAPTAEGKTFKEWNTKKDGTGSAWDFTTPIEGNTKLYAIWTD